MREGKSTQGHIEVNMKPEGSTGLHCECKQLAGSLLQLPVSINYLYSMQTFHLSILTKRFKDSFLRHNDGRKTCHRVTFN